MRNKQEIVDEIERLIDHYTPYRPILDSEGAKESRKALGLILNFVLEVSSE